MPSSPKKPGGRKRKRMYQSADEKEVKVEKKAPVKKKTATQKSKAKKVEPKKKQPTKNKTTKKEKNVEMESEPDIYIEVPSDKVVIEIVSELRYKGSVLSESEHERLEKVLKNNLYLSMGTSLIPVPFLDAFVVSSVQIKMILEISRVYGVPVKKELVKSYIASLLGMFGYGVGNQMFKSVLKMIPVVNMVAFLSSPVMAAGTTYALAKVFVYHYELGGNLLDFKPEKVRAYFADQFENGKSVMNKMKTEFNTMNQL